jgi:hypothetical protein
MNAERTAQGLRSLQVEPLLGRVATGYARHRRRAVGAPIALGAGELGGTHVTDFGRRRRG